MPKAKPVAEPMKEIEILGHVIRAADDKKAENIQVIDLTDRSSFADYILICHGSSDRQVKAITDAITQSLREVGQRPLGIEGEDLCQWVLIDYAGVVVHVFYEPLRGFYDLEGLWSDAPTLDIEPFLS